MRRVLNREVSFQFVLLTRSSHFTFLCAFRMFDVQINACLTDQDQFHSCQLVAVLDFLLVNRAVFYLVIC